MKKIFPLLFISLFIFSCNNNDHELIGSWDYSEQQLVWDHVKEIEEYKLFRYSISFNKDGTGNVLYSDYKTFGTIGPMFQTFTWNSSERKIIIKYDPGPTHEDDYSILNNYLTFKPNSFLESPIRFKKID